MTEAKFDSKMQIDIIIHNLLHNTGLLNGLYSIFKKNSVLFLWQAEEKLHFFR